MWDFKNFSLVLTVGKQLQICPTSLKSLWYATKVEGHKKHQAYAMVFWTERQTLHTFTELLQHVLFLRLLRYRARFPDLGIRATNKRQSPPPIDGVRLRCEHILPSQVSVWRTWLQQPLFGETETPNTDSSYVCFSTPVRPCSQCDFQQSSPPRHKTSLFSLLWDLLSAHFTISISF